MALAAYRTAVMLAPRDVDARMKLAETINRNGDIAGWATELESVLAIDPRHGEAHARLAVAQYYLGNREAAREEIVLAERFGGAVPPQLKDLVNN
jgi:Tfp pilus assembly protein PilF